MPPRRRVNHDGWLGTVRSVITLLGFLLLYAPLAVVILYSVFVKVGAAPRFWSFQGYQKVFENPDIVAAISRSLEIGVMTALIATPVGTLFSLGFVRNEFRFKGVMNALLSLPLLLPELLLGLALLLWFVMLKVTLGVWSITLAHVTFSVSYVVLTVRARLEGLDRQLEEAARDLGANRLQCLLKVTLPLLMPAIVAGALIAFTLSFDDFLVTFFTSGVGSDTLPLKLYSMVRYQPEAEVNALSTLTLLVTASLALAVNLVSGLKRR